MTGNKNNRGNEEEKNIHKIYFIVPEISTRFPQNILEGITDFCDKRAMDASIKISKGNLMKEERYIRSALSSDAKELILFPIGNESANEALLNLSANRYPITIIDRYFKNINFVFISTDHYRAMLDVIKFLAAKNIRISYT